jgi:hypothetical protein
MLYSASTGLPQIHFKNGLFFEGSGEPQLVPASGQKNCQKKLGMNRSQVKGSLALVSELWVLAARRKAARF